MNRTRRLVLLQGQHAVQEHADDDHQKQKAGAASGVEASIFADIFHRQGQSGLVAGDGFMLRPVVLKDPVDLLHPGDSGHVGQEDGEP